MRKSYLWISTEQMMIEIWFKNKCLQVTFPTLHVPFQGLKSTSKDKLRRSTRPTKKEREWKKETSMSSTLTKQKLMLSLTAFTRLVSGIMIQTSRMTKRSEHPFLCIFLGLHKITFKNRINEGCKIWCLDYILIHISFEALWSLLTHFPQLQLSSSVAFYIHEFLN